MVKAEAGAMSDAMQIFKAAKMAGMTAVTQKSGHQHSACGDLAVTAGGSLACRQPVKVNKEFKLPGAFAAR